MGFTLLPEISTVELKMIAGFSQTLLYEPPHPQCDYFRDSKILPFTMDFSFIADMLRLWPEACAVVSYYASEDGLCTFRFRSSDGLDCLPLSGKPAPVAPSLIKMREVPRCEFEECFVTRFFQYRLMYERQLRGSGVCSEMLPYENIRESIRINESLCNSFRAIVNERLVPFPFSRSSAGEPASVYCPIDGWVEPLNRRVAFENSVSLAYLLCPVCLGNIDYAEQ